MIATAGLIVAIDRVERESLPNGAAVIASWIAAAYWFTSSTSFANPAACVGRMLTDTFAGIRPTDVPAFIVAEGVGTLAGLAVAALFRRSATHA